MGMYAVAEGYQPL